MESIIKHHQHKSLASGIWADLLYLHSGQVIVVTQSTLAVYKDEASIGDPLGNGLIGIADVPVEHRFDTVPESGFIAEFRSGYVRLRNQKVILITPFKLSLFVSSNDALIGKNPLCAIELTPVDLR